MKVIIDKSERFLRTPQTMMGNMRLTGKLLERRGMEYIDLNSVVPELPDYQPFIDKLKSSDMHDITYAGDDEISLLKEKLAQMHQEIYNRKINPVKDIAITPGNRITAMLLCLGFANNSDVVALPDPGLAMYRMAAVMAGAVPKTYSLLEKNDYLPNLNALFEPPPKNLKLVFLNYPHNPTGAEAELYFYRDLINQLRYENILLVLDSPFCGSSDPAIEFPLQLKKAKHLFVELHSFGFPYGLEGLGFAIGHRGAIDNITQIIKFSGYYPTRSQVKYALTALEFHNELSERFVSIISERRKLLADGLKEIGWKIRAGRLAPFIWAKVPPWATSVGFTRKMFVRTGVWAKPGTDFGENGEGYLRLSLTISNEKIGKALNNISEKSSMLRKRGK
ncbi:MAG: aminotransferase class I/II-fold pyridoxal phosphate-dependent enzyme [candidate division Zixibacteria bacterium]|nr:aminotransferase class I/II-fold pyridoxal phosphate-dependent enzyme [candidate division Zixibacteria bacterium]